MQQAIWKFLGNRFVEAHTHGNARVTETELVEVLFSFRSSVCSQELSLLVHRGELPIYLESSNNYPMTKNPLSLP
jgi:hypothetical protein